MTRTKDELYADWCAARGVSDEAERAAREAYEATVNAEGKAATGTKPKQPK